MATPAQGGEYETTDEERAEWLRRGSMTASRDFERTLRDFAKLKARLDEAERLSEKELELAAELVSERQRLRKRLEEAGKVIEFYATATDEHLREDLSLPAGSSYVRPGYRARKYLRDHLSADKPKEPSND